MRKWHLTGARLWLCLVLGASVVWSVAGCGPTATPTGPQRVLNVGMLLAQGGLGDRSFSDSAYLGLQEAQRRYEIRFETADYTSDEANLEALRRFARQDYDLILAVGFENAGYIQTVAKEYPNRPFGIIDSVAEGGNVASIIYREQEGDFLMGVLTAMLTKTDKVGFIGGVDMDIIRRIEAGYRQGVAFENDQVEVVSDMAGTFADSDVGKALALAQYGQGVDIIYNAAGRTGLGIIEAAAETGNLTIGTSGDQRYLAPGNVIGNRPKRVDTAVLTLVREVKEGTFEPGVRSLGLKEEGLSIGPFDDSLVTPAMADELEALRKKIIAGEIVVTDSTGG